MRRTTGMSSRLAADVWQHLRNRDQRPRPAIEARLRVVNDAESGSTRIDLMDEIGFWGITAQDFVDELLAIDAATIELHINSPGGDVFDGVAIMNALADHSATVNVVVDGLAASAASFIAMAGDSVKMNRGSQLMIHDAAGMCWGNAADMESMKDLLDRISDMIAELYAERAGGKAGDWRDLMRAETWYSAAEAVSAGLADEAASGKAAEEDPEAAEEDPEAEPEEDPPGGDGPPAEDPEEDPEDVAARAARVKQVLSQFKHTGRAQAPAPPTPGRRPVQYDPDTFRAAIRKGMTS